MMQITAASPHFIYIGYQAVSTSTIYHVNRLTSSYSMGLTCPSRRFIKIPTPSIVTLPSMLLNRIISLAYAILISYILPNRDDGEQNTWIRQPYSSPIPQAYISSLLLDLAGALSTLHGIDVQLKRTCRRYPRPKRLQRMCTLAAAANAVDWLSNPVSS
jgi:hypothetical protein